MPCAASAWRAGRPALPPHAARAVGRCRSGPRPRVQRFAHRSQFAQGLFMVRRCSSGRLAVAGEGAGVATRRPGPGARRSSVRAAGGGCSASSTAPPPVASTSPSAPSSACRTAHSARGSRFPRRISKMVAMSAPAAVSTSWSRSAKRRPRRSASIRPTAFCRRPSVRPGARLGAGFIVTIIS